MNSPEPGQSSPHAPATPRGFSRWRRLTIGLLAFALTILLFYGEENWRGKRAWQKYRKELEAQGQWVDWTALIPPPVPDEQNVFKAPQMEWFIRGAAPNAFSERFSELNDLVRSRATDRVIVAELTVSPTATESRDARGPSVVAFDDPGARRQVLASIDRATGHYVNGAQGFLLTSIPLDQIKPARLSVQSNRPLTPDQLSEVVPGFKIEPNGSNSFLVTGEGLIGAADYLAWTAQSESDFDLIREALQRPYARLDGDYHRPFKAPVPNFVALRTTAQILGQRAQCFFLLGQPERALEQLTLIQQMRRLLEGPPTGKPRMLVSAMIDVAINGMYVATIRDGIRLGVLREPQLLALQEQLKGIDLIPIVAASLDSGELPAVCHSFEFTPFKELRRAWLSPGEAAKPSIYDFLPRGWLYQNIIVYAKLMRQYADSVDVSSRVIVPHRIDQAGEAVEAAFASFSPFTLVAKIGIPNVAKAFKTAARNQTLANQAEIVCALERYRLAHGEYPETLAALSPRFMAEIPHDVIGGKTPRYHRAAGGKFRLYSIGWSEQDHGGSGAKDEGDWVWTWDY